MGYQVGSLKEGVEGIGVKDRWLRENSAGGGAHVPVVARNYTVWVEHGDDLDDKGVTEATGELRGPG